MSGRRRSVRPAAKVAARNEVVELTFLGTRGEIKLRSRRHQRHSALLVEHEDARIMIDCGADWLGRLHGIAPTAIVLTHAHLDHAGGLAQGAPCPVYATSETRTFVERSSPIVVHRSCAAIRARRVRQCASSAVSAASMHASPAMEIGCLSPGPIGARNRAEARCA